MIVVDANVIAYLVILSEQTTLAESVSRIDRDWRAPWLWRSELLNILAGYIRRGTLSIDGALMAMNAARSAVTDVSVDEISVLELISTSKCTSYDCEYVAAAQSLGTRLVTADKQLLRSFPDVAVSMREFVGFRS
jgi:predicted nucleic acid-binding protein